MTSSNESFDASQYKVLCVDDEPNILSALRRMLSLEGLRGSQQKAAHKRWSCWPKNR